MCHQGLNLVCFVVRELQSTDPANNHDQAKAAQNACDRIDCGDLHDPAGFRTGDVTQLRAAVREIRADAEARLTEIMDRPTQYETTGGPFPGRLPIVAITGKLLMGQYEAVVRWARWAEDAVGEWTGVTPATGATVPPCAFTSGWPAR